MISPSENATIQNFKTVLDESLSRKFVDLSLYLGLITQLQCQLHKWICDDIAEYSASCSSLTPNAQASFKLTDFLELLWTQFHHPIIKMFLLQLAELHSELVDSFKNSKKKLKVVEMRKVNESFTKYVRLATSFYNDILGHLAKNYANLLIPQNYLKDLNITISHDKGTTQSKEFEANLLYVMYMSLIGLGNLSRHAAHLTITYVQPSKSVSAYYKHLKQAEDPSQKKLYLTPLLYYSKCIGLFPTLNEPYNHIGVIYNSIQQKFSAALWFLRSQFTRHQQTKVGQYNMVSIFTRPWLDVAYRDAIRKAAHELEISDVNNILLRILADYFYPQAYKQPLYRKKIESDLVERLFKDLCSNRLLGNSSIVMEHLSMMFCFYKLAETEKPQLCSQFASFIINYFTHYLNRVVASSDLDEETEVALKVVRLFLAFSRKNRVFLEVHKKEVLSALVDTLNKLMNEDEEARRETLESFSEGSRPVRTHYFTEDVQFKDFSPIGFQFKDFDDDHLFESGNIDLLFGSYYYTQNQDMPAYLDNAAMNRINKVMELESGERNRKDLIQTEIRRHENNLRLNAIAVQLKAFYDAEVSVDEVNFTIKVAGVEVPRTQSSQEEQVEQKSKKGKKKNKKKSKNTLKIEEVLAGSDVDTSGSVKIAPPALFPSSLEEIELMILGHVSQLAPQQPRSDLNTELGIADMVNSILSEEESTQAELPEHPAPSFEINATSQGTQREYSQVGLRASSQQTDPSSLAENVSRATPVQLLRHKPKQELPEPEVQELQPMSMPTQPVHHPVIHLQYGGFQQVPLNSPYPTQSPYVAPHPFAAFAPPHGQMPQFGNPPSQYGQFPPQVMPQGQWNYSWAPNGAPGGEHPYPQYQQ